MAKTQRKLAAYPGLTKFLDCLAAAGATPFLVQIKLYDALIELYPDSRFGHFSLSSEPVWAWLYSVFDRQDAIKELLNCVLRAVGQKNGGPIWTVAS